MLKVSSSEIPRRVKRGEIYWVELDPVKGNEIRKTRPCLIISNDEQNEVSQRVMVIRTIFCLFLIGKEAVLRVSKAVSYKKTKKELNISQSIELIPHTLRRCFATHQGYYNEWRENPFTHEECSIEQQEKIVIKALLGDIELLSRLQDLPYFLFKGISEEERQKLESKLVQLRVEIKPKKKKNYPKKFFQVLKND
ncbi:type II toxin-antitoxin system PemK/MazF family toxin [endosymbiont GvMRE of Glomus versiforme]|uniref:type II toxin-antitoxin system PemK/MazF family toxin n=1 Tax=endosymbiont GvMRE of Glomus versiforme TaxID=2039283 RepID=UPI000EC09852|nr:type II toxin-antitoxin system PemK/MazF family toxin [endosymbiont GvMRE of Glomus versiforme]RHZ35649.1 mRNA interferase [endosymbiont GvMRE of Glomus versiforme]